MTGTASAALAPQPGRLGIPTSREGHTEKHSRFRRSKKNERSDFARLDPRIDGSDCWSSGVVVRRGWGLRNACGRSGVDCSSWRGQWAVQRAWMDATCGLGIRQTC